MKQTTRGERGDGVSESNRAETERTGSRTPGRRRSGHRNEVLVGIAVVAGVLLLFFGVRFLDDGRILSDSYTLHAEFPRANGLLPGSDVTLNGVDIGSVRSLALVPETHRVAVEMEIADDIRIPAGSTARIGGISALNDVHVAVTPGPMDAEPLGDGDTLDGAVEPGIAERADSTLAEVDVTFEQAQSLLSNTEGDLAVVLAHLQRASGGAASFVESEQGRLRSAVASIQSAAEQLNRAAAQLDQVTATGGDTLMIALNSLSETMRRLDTVAASLERSAASAERMMAAVDTGAGTIGRLVHDPALYVRLDSAAARLDTAAARMGALLEDFQADPGRYLGKMSLIDIF